MPKYDIIEGEIWKDIKCIPYHQAEWPFHQVSNKGRVRVLPGGKFKNRLVTKIELRTLTLCNNGYVKIDRGRGTVNLIHHLVLNQFRGPCPSDKDECRHLNGIRSDNRLENLEWGTQEEQYQDKIRHGTAYRGERHVNSKLTEADIAEIKKRPESSRQIAAQYGVNHATIRRIRSGKMWKHVLC